MPTPRPSWSGLRVATAPHDSMASSIPDGTNLPRCQAVRGAWHAQLANACIRYQWTLKRPV
jgi:hypothetical protein